MNKPDISRRELLLQGSATLALLHAPWFAHAFPSRPGEEVVPWLDQPGANPSGGVVELSSRRCALLNTPPQRRGVRLKSEYFLSCYLTWKRRCSFALRTDAFFLDAITRSS